MPELYIITGSNGAGKSSIGPEYLPINIREQGPVFDGDKPSLKNAMNIGNPALNLIKSVETLPGLLWKNPLTTG